MGGSNTWPTINTTEASVELYSPPSPSEIVAFSISFVAGVSAFTTSQGWEGSKILLKLIRIFGKGNHCTFEELNDTKPARLETLRLPWAVCCFLHPLPPPSSRHLQGAGQDPLSWRRRTGKPSGSCGGLRKQCRTLIC